MDPPVRLTWRTSAETLAHHRNLLLCTELGLSSNRSLTVDALHCLYLGVMNVWCRTTIGTICLSSVFGEVGSDAHLQTAVTVIHHENSRSGTEGDVVTQQRSLCPKCCTHLNISRNVSGQREISCFVRSALRDLVAVWNESEGCHLMSDNGVSISTASTWPSWRPKACSQLIHLLNQTRYHWNARIYAT